MKLCSQGSALPNLRTRLVDEWVRSRLATTNRKKKHTRMSVFLRFGGDKGIRTPGLLNAIQTRYQLRHAPMDSIFIAFL